MHGRALVLLASVTFLAPGLAMAAGNEATQLRGTDVVAVDGRVLMNAPVERNGKEIGKVQRVMVNPITGRIDHVDILMTEGDNRAISVPWSGLSVSQNNSGSVTLSLTSRTAAEASPSVGRPSTTSPRAAMDLRTSQQELKDRGYYSGPLDGVLGPNTQAALRDYQRDHGLKVTGRLDSRTVGSLSGEATTAATQTPYPSALPAMDVSTAQQELKNRGYYPGPVDGVLGPNTQRALLDYQRDQRLKMTGRLDSSTVRSLSAITGARQG